MRDAISKLVNGTAPDSRKYRKGGEHFEIDLSLACKALIGRAE